MVGLLPLPSDTESGGDSETYTKAVSLNRFPAILIKANLQKGR
jgi:hypothetical protein